MPVIPHTKQHQIEADFSGAFCKEIAQHEFVFCRGQTRFDFTLNPMHIAGRQCHMVEQRFLHHAIIAVRVVRRHSALIPPENMHLRPADMLGIFRGSQQFIERTRCAATRHCHRKITVILNRFLIEMQHIGHGCIHECRWIVIDAQVSHSHHLPCQVSGRWPILTSCWTGSYRPEPALTIIMDAAHPPDTPIIVEQFVSLSRSPASRWITEWMGRAVRLPGFDDRVHQFP